MCDVKINTHSNEMWSGIGEVYWAGEASERSQNVKCTGSIIPKSKRKLDFEKGILFMPKSSMYIMHLSICNLSIPPLPLGHTTGI